jgi:hypothetical protein
MPTTSSNFIYIGNLGDVDTNETNNQNENPSVLFQNYSNSDISDVTVDQTDSNGDGQLQTNNQGQTADTFTYDVGGGSVTNDLDNGGRYFVDYIDENGDPQSKVVSVYQTVNGDTFVKFPNGLKVSSLTINGMASDNYSSITYGTSSSSTVVCFASDTLIDTPSGPRAVEDLNVGDAVETLDHGLQTIRWMRKSEHFLEKTDDKPILISAGALGPRRPAQDLIVSPQHRILVGGEQQLVGRFRGEVFAPAKALTVLPGVRQMRGKKTVTWIHFSCDWHEVVFANGCLTETLLLGEMVLQGLSETSRQIVTEMYGEVTCPTKALNGPPARDCLKVGDVRRQLQSRPQNAKFKDKAGGKDVNVAMVQFKITNQNGSKQLH